MIINTRDPFTQHVFEGKNLSYVADIFLFHWLTVSITTPER